MPKHVWLSQVHWMAEQWSPHGAVWSAYKHSATPRILSLCAQHMRLHKYHQVSSLNSISSFKWKHIWSPVLLSITIFFPDMTRGADRRAVYIYTSCDYLSPRVCTEEKGFVQRQRSIEKAPPWRDLLQACPGINENAIVANSAWKKKTVQDSGPQAQWCWEMCAPVSFVGYFSDSSKWLRIQERWKCSDEAKRM